MVRRLDEWMKSRRREVPAFILMISLGQVQPWFSRLFFCVEGINCCPRRKGSTSMFLFSQMEKMGMKSYDKSLRYAHANEQQVLICLFCESVVRIYLGSPQSSGREWARGSPRTLPPPPPRCASMTAMATRTGSSSQTSTSSWF